MVQDGITVGIVCIFTTCYDFFMCLFLWTDVRLDAGIQGLYANERHLGFRMGWI